MGSEESDFHQWISEAIESNGGKVWDCPPNHLGLNITARRFFVAPDPCSMSLEDTSLGENKRRDFSGSKGVATNARPDGWYNQFNQRRVRK